MVRVAKLLVAKLGDFVLPSVDTGSEEDLENEAEDYEENDINDKSEGTMCLYLHKRDDQPAHEVVQKVLRYSIKNCDYYVCLCSLTLTQFLRGATYIKLRTNKDKNLGILS